MFYLSLVFFPFQSIPELQYQTRIKLGQSFDHKYNQRPSLVSVIINVNLRNVW